ncbi:adenylate/guanylate cyclase domain-containing protein [Accumulibacter sp.]|nr:adenylate/guanylate cyclase domain-containing protein [Accumulibacter sp.]MDS4054502.1 adenylate/guanylate cyclase domain-containing protein [Accumulibacter sp.]HMW63581.1 adenylate/guanylate cyclase domain-containing protein [Accumulibacter sp.]HNC25402.1 adenylate/guanylate cyclase domain-containing protein [Accumulibacter sp.]HNE40728.1 adenylate/guanylate cyclase domain-containing protein [Accumulibacter sp.]HNJ49623.1 adenylate/guanylate cyclase domain-containing protein [Accumulibacte
MNEQMLSVLVAGVSDGARLFDRLGGAEALHAVDRCMKRITRGIEMGGGRVIRSSGDQVMAVFHSAHAACQAAITMQRRIADLPPVSGMQLAIHAGFHHGAVAVEDGDVIGESATLAEALASVALSGQVLITESTRALLPAQLQTATRSLPASLSRTLRVHESVYEVRWPEAKGPLVVAAAVEPAPPLAKERESRLCLRYGPYVKVVDRNRPSLLMGRDVECEIPVRDRRASRHHARIERRDDQFVLSDLSTNGTFVTIKGEPELFLRREAFVLRGSGIISFAASASTQDADIAEFEHL